MRCPKDKTICNLCGNRTIYWKEVLECPIIQEKTIEERRSIDEILAKHEIYVGIREILKDINQQGL